MPGSRRTQAEEFFNRIIEAIQVKLILKNFCSFISESGGCDSISFYILPLNITGKSTRIQLHRDQALQSNEIFATDCGGTPSKRAR